MFRGHFRHDFTDKALPVVRLFSEFADGGVDLKYPDNQQWSPDVKAGKSVSYSAAVVANVDGVSVLAVRKDAPLESIKTLGTVKGVTAWSWAEQIKSGKVQLHENNTFSGLVQQVLAGRGGAGRRRLCQRLDGRLPIEKHEQGGGVGFRPAPAEPKKQLSLVNHPQLIAEFDQWMVEKSSFLAEMKKKYQVE